MMDSINYEDITLILSNIGEHKCSNRKIESKDLQGNTIHNTYVGFSCSTCNTWFRIPLSVVKAMPVPLRKYLQTIENRQQLAEEFTKDSRKLLLELRNSGGWFQPDPGIAFLTMLAASIGAENNPMEQKLKSMFASKPLPN